MSEKEKKSYARKKVQTTLSKFFNSKQPNKSTMARDRDISQQPQ